VKNKLYISLVVVLLCLFLGTERAQLQKITPTRQAWEYKTVTLYRQYSTGDFDETQMRKNLEDLGYLGWELVAVNTMEDATPSGNLLGTKHLVQYFKRPK
jgi:hypothetical protein